MELINDSLIFLRAQLSATRPYPSVSSRPATSAFNRCSCWTSRPPHTGERENRKQHRDFNIELEKYNSIVYNVM